jgi:hypothetical protein
VRVSRERNVWIITCYKNDVKRACFTNGFAARLDGLGDLCYSEPL